MTCRGICVRYKAGRPSFRQSRYATGQKRCQICELFIKWDGLICPCCSYRLRLKPRNMKSKIRLRNDKNTKALAVSILADLSGSCYGK